MVKKVIATSLVVAGLIFVGCGDGEGESRLKTQSMLDNGDYTGIIDRLDGVATTDSENIMLGSAYMGKAGFGIPDIIEMILEEDDDSSGDSDAFAKFIEKTEDKKSSTSISDLRKSSTYYKEALGDIDCADTNLSDSSKNVCLYLGLSETVKSATAITYIVDDVAALTEDSKDDPKLKASACAMMYAFDKTKMKDDCTAVEGAKITFDNNQTYTKLTMNTDYDFLITESNATAITEGYCTLTDFSTRADEKASELYHVCPLNESKFADDEITTVNVLVDALNNGTGAIAGSATDDMKKDIDEFKCDVFLGTYDEHGDTCLKNGSNIDLEDDLDVSQVIDYLSKKAE